MTDYEPRCSVHGDEDAGWRCDSCKKHLCGECTARLLNSYFCAHCEAPASQLTEPRVEKPFSVWLTDAVTFPFRSWLAVLGTAVVVLIAGSAGDGAFAWIGRVVGPLAVVAFGMAMLTMGARRDTTALARSMLRVVVATAILWVPGLAYVWLAGQPLRGEMAALYGALVVAYVPVVLVSSATDVSVASALNPFLVFEWLWRVKGRYVLYLTVAAVLGAAAFGASRGAWNLTSMGFVNDGVRVVVSLALLAMSARLLGTLAHVHGDAFDWGRPESYVDPLYPDLQATAARKSLIRDTEKMREFGEENSMISPEQREVRAAREIVECIRADRMRRALKLYLERDTWADDRFDDRELMALGTAANMAKKYDVAVGLLERAAAAEGRAGARALYSLARIHAGALDDAQRARELYRRVVDEFPESDVARLSRKELGE